jgi:serine/threonine-protein kinase 24/25/MST4
VNEGDEDMMLEGVILPALSSVSLGLCHLVKVFDADSA